MTGSMSRMEEWTWMEGGCGMTTEDRMTSFLRVMSQVGGISMVSPVWMGMTPCFLWADEGEGSLEDCCCYGMKCLDGGDR